MIIAALCAFSFVAGYAFRVWHERQYHRGSLTQGQAVESLMPYLGRMPDDPGPQ